jgi:outer membrane receptor for ferrienterochelin and colicins
MLSSRHLAAALLVAILSSGMRSGAQSVGVTVRVVTDQTTDDEPVPDAVVRSGRIGARTGADGRATLMLAAGAREIVATKIGFLPDSVRLVLRVGADTAIKLELKAAASAIVGVVVSAMRSGHSAESEPTKVEVVEPEDVREKAAMTPGNARMILSEAPGVRVVTTAPALGAASVRLQGLRGRYTAVLTDGLPLLGASTEGLGLLQLPPVDLDHVEIIKGAASALYGAAALGGVVNLVSRRPAHDETEAVLNQSSQDATDVVLWTADSVTEHWGYTVLGGAHRQRAQDLAGTGWYDVAGYTRGVLRPRVYWNGDGGQSVFVTVGAMGENRIGGTAPAAVLSDGDPYPFELRTRRYDAGTIAVFPLGSTRSLSVRGSGTVEALAHLYGSVRERDRLGTGYAEASVTTTEAEHTWIAGAAVRYDDLHARDVAGFDYAFTTPGLFAQDTYTPAWVSDSALALTVSARVDHHVRYGTVASPRLAFLLKPLTHYTLRLSGGLGFSAPTPFTEEISTIGLTPLRSFNATGQQLLAEHARSGSADLTAHYGPVRVNGSVFASTIGQPVALSERPDGAGLLRLVNLAGASHAAGTELVARWKTDDIDFFGYYSYLHTSELDPDTGLRRETPLTPRHQAGMDALVEPIEGMRLGLEAFYTGRQSLVDDPYRATSRPFVTFGVLVQVQVGQLQFFANAENITDIRQTRYDPIVLPRRGPGGRWTTDAWAPLDGRVLNVGVHLSTARRSAAP